MKRIAFLMLAGLLASCTSTKYTVAPTQTANFGKMPDGRTAKIFTLSNSSGMEAKVTEYGAILVGIKVPDRNGKAEDVTLGYDTLDGWLTNTSYFGSTVGRYGNRIAHGKFTLDGKEYTLATNNDPGGIPCALHGGLKGFDKVLWTGTPVSKTGAQGVAFTYTAKDGEEGYPGNLKVKVTYWLTGNNELVWEAEATTDKATPVNIVHHSYWNLTGDARNTINNCVLMLPANKYLPTDAGLIPTGQLASVKGTPMDFTKPTPIGQRVNENFEALKLGGGYDHCWVLNNKVGMHTAARLHDPASGRTLTLTTDQPGVQFYGGNFLDGKVAGKGGVAYQFRTGLCLETQHYPDSPNQPTFPNCILRPGQTYKHTMVHKFTVE